MRTSSTYISYRYKSYRYVWLYYFYVGWVLHLLVERIKFFFFCFFFKWAKFLCFCFVFFPYGMSFWIGWRFSFVRMVARECLRQMGSMCVKKDKKSKKRKREGERGGQSGGRKGERDRGSYTSFNNPLNIRPHYFNEHIISPSVCTIYPQPIN